MINVIDRRCQEADCPKFPSHNYPGSHKKLYCATHKKEGMVSPSDSIAYLQVTGLSQQFCFVNNGKLLLLYHNQVVTISLI